MALSNKPLWLAVTWTCTILVLLSIPGSSFPSNSSLFEYDKLVHAGLFFILALLWLSALAGRSVLRAIGILLLIIVFSFASEAYQELLPFDRTADVFDAIADTVGALLGFSVWGIKSACTRTVEK